MRNRIDPRRLAALGVALVLCLSACATATPAGSSGVSVSGGTPASTATGTMASGTQASIPSAPGTAGSSAQPPPASAPLVTTAAGVVATPLPDCRASEMKTVVTGRLTFTTGDKTKAPWFVGDPADGRGFEPAVAVAVAKELGYATGSIVWSKSDLARVAAGKASGFDVAVGEFATPDQPGGPVDYSTGYFSISQSVVARTGSAAAKVTALAGLKTLRLGAISPARGSKPATTQITTAKSTDYATVTAGLAALQSGSVDAVLLPTPAAVAAGPSVTIIGQLTDPTEQPQQFGMILPKHSRLTGCISAAIDQLRVTGALAALVKEWVPSAVKPLT